MAEDLPGEELGELFSLILDRMVKAGVDYVNENIVFELTVSPAV